MALAALQSLGATPTENALYLWCAQYCTYRDNRQPTQVANLPVVMVNRTPRLVRHVFNENGVTKLIVASKQSRSANVELSTVTVPTGATSAQAIFGYTVGTVGDSRAAVEGLVTGNIIMIGSDDREGYDLVGAGGTRNAAPPNYRIIGVVARNAQNTDKTVSVNVLIRGQHFVTGHTPTVGVPIMGLDKFTTGISNRSRGVITSAIQKAYDVAQGRTTGAAAADISVTNPTTVTVNDKPATLTELRDQVVGRLSGDARNYGTAMNTPIMYTYARGTTAELSAALTTAIGQLEITKMNGLADTIEAARTVRTTLFGAAQTQVGGTDTGGFSQAAANTVRDLETRLRQTEQELNAERQAVQRLRQQLAAGPTPMPGVPVPARRPTIPLVIESPALLAARQSVQKVGRELLDLTKRARTDPSLQGVIARLKLELAAALRVVDALMA